MELSVETFDQICRACLSSSTNMKSLFTKLDGDEKSLLDLFSLAANLTARTEDGLPKQVCSDCELTLYKAEEFRKTCLQSDTILKELFSNSTHDHDTNHSENEEDVKNKLLFFDKISDFEIQVVEKKDIVDNNQDFGSDLFVQDNQKHDDYLNNVKQEAFDNDQDLENDYDEVELEIPIELKKEAPLKPKATNYSQYKKQWKSKKKTTKIPFRYTCKECNLDFDDEKLSIDHLQGHTKVNKEENESYQCSLCFRHCKTKKTLSKHMKLHQQTDNIRYSCDRCKREFKYKSFLENHVISVHMHNEYNCHVCKEKFKSKQILEAHIDTHKEKKKHICNVCSKAFIMLCTLKDHMRKHTGEKPFLCCTCGKGFSQKTNLAQHTRRHLGVKPFKCNICSKCFVSKGELDAHTRKHSGAHPFVCDDCGNGFTTSSALVKHRRTHTGERPYACDLCHMRFAASGTLKNHRRTHTGERPFQCSLCEKAFVQRTDLISHIRCHTGERPYICSQCGQAFRKAAGLKAHLKMHGKDLPGMHGVILNGGRE